MDLLQRMQSVNETRDTETKALIDAIEAITNGGLVFNNEDGSLSTYSFTYYRPDGTQVETVGLPFHKAREIEDEAFYSGGTIEIKEIPAVIDNEEEDEDEAFSLISLLPEQDQPIKGEIILPLTKAAAKILPTVRMAHGKTRLEVASKREKAKGKTLGTYLSVRDEQDNELKGLQGFTLAVQGAIGSMYRDGQRSVSYKQIWAKLTQANEHDNPGSEIIQRLKAAIYEGGNIWVTIQYAQEITRDPNSEPIQADLYIKRRLINANPCGVRVNGAVCEGIKIVEMPPLFQHAEEVKQLANIKAEWLEIEGLRNTADNIAIKWYLADQCNRAIREKRATLALKYETIYQQLENPNPSPDGQRRKRANIAKILDSYVSKGLISSWKQEKKPGTKTLYKVVIRFNSKTLKKGGKDGK